MSASRASNRYTLLTGIDLRPAGYDHTAGITIWLLAVDIADRQQCSAMADTVQACWGPRALAWLSGCCCA